MQRTIRQVLRLGLWCGLAAGCALDASGLPDPFDASPPERDAGAPAADAGSPRDAGALGERDAGHERDAGAPAPSCPRDAEALVLCLPFDGDARDRAGDNDAVPSAVDFGPGVVGQAVEVGPGSGLLIPEDGSQAVPTATLEVWVRADALPGAGDRAGLVDFTTQLSLFVYEGGDVRCDANAPAWDRGGLRAGVWTHYACTFGVDEIVLYRDGAEVARTPYSGLSQTSSGGWIGEDGPGGGDQLAGAIDELRLWGSVRTREEIRAEALRPAR